MLRALCLVLRHSECVELSAQCCDTLNASSSPHSTSHIMSDGHVTGMQHGIRCLTRKNYVSGIIVPKMLRVMNRQWSCKIHVAFKVLTVPSQVRCDCVLSAVVPSQVKSWHTKCRLCCCETDAFAFRVLAVPSLLNRHRLFVQILTIRFTGQTAARPLQSRCVLGWA